MHGFSCSGAPQASPNINYWDQDWRPATIVREFMKSPSLCSPYFFGCHLWVTPIQLQFVVWCVEAWTESQLVGLWRKIWFKNLIWWYSLSCLDFRSARLSKAHERLGYCTGNEQRESSACEQQAKEDDTCFVYQSSRYGQSVSSCVECMAFWPRDFMILYENPLSLCRRAPQELSWPPLELLLIVIEELSTIVAKIVALTLKCQRWYVSGVGWSLVVVRNASV